MHAGLLLRRLDDQGVTAPHLRAARRPCRAAAAAGGLLVVAACVLTLTLPALAQAPSPARVTVVPGCTTPEAPIGQLDLAVAGEQFNPYTAVLVSFDAAAGGRPETFTARTDGFGRFKTTVRPSARPPGTYVVRADDLRQREATAVLAPCPPPEEPTPEIPEGEEPPTGVSGDVFNPTLALRPALGQPGFVTVAVGSGFPPGAPVALAWSPGLTARRSTVVSDASGAFRVPVLVFHHDQLGPRRLRAKPAGAVPFPEATAAFLVVPGRAQPLDFRTRR